MYRQVSVLNNGAYGQVYLVENTKTKQRFAAKKYYPRKRHFCSCKCVDEAAHELRVHKLVKSHPNIVKLVRYDKKTKLLYFEYCPRGDLYEAIRRHDVGPWAARKVMLQLCDVVAHCHANGVYHRDIKPENIMVGPNNTFKLTDWGLACTDQFTSDCGAGSEEYMAPECFGDQTYDAAAADVWSLGICLLNVLFGRCPFKQATSEDRLFEEFAACKESLFDVFPHLSLGVYNALQYALAVDPKKRSLERFRTALSQVNVWTTREEIQQFSLVEECVPLSQAMNVPRTKSHRPPLPLPTPRDRDHGGRWSLSYDSERSSSRCSTCSSVSSQTGVFDLDLDCGIDNTHTHIDTPKHNDTPIMSFDDPSSGSSNASARTCDFTCSVPPPSTLMSMSWADVDEDFYMPQSAPKPQTLALPLFKENVRW